MGADVGHCKTCRWWECHNDWSEWDVTMGKALGDCTSDKAHKHHASKWGKGVDWLQTRAAYSCPKWEDRP